jgi:L-Ala-D/L-Glu epimerase
MTPAELSITVGSETWPLASAFVISRGAKTHANVIVATITDGTSTGRGEAVPYARYGETIDGALACIAGVVPELKRAPGEPVSSIRARLQTVLPAGAARNALDCALWDFEAKATGRSVAALMGIAEPTALLTAYTLSLDAPDAMANAARRVAHLPLLKLKLGGLGDAERLRAIRAARPDARLIVDANEAWTPALLAQLLAVCCEVGVEVVEQPLPAHDDAALDNRPRGVAVCADESLHTRADLPRLAQRYDAINIKLDKAGGLTEAHALAGAAEALGLGIMIGCMVGTSLAMAPALLIAARAKWVDLDGPLLLAKDRDPGLVIADGIISPPVPALWG